MRIIHEALTFDDVLLEPAYSEVLPREVELKTRLTRALTLNIPMLSAAMDTVTEARLAITLAQEGGIGIIHKNMPPEEQARHVRRVKKFESGVINDPITVTPDATIREVIELTRAKNISGVPVVKGEDLVGIVTHRDLRFETQREAPVSAVMTPKERLVTVREGADKDEVLGLLHRHRIEKVLVVDRAFKLRGMITVKDIQKATEYPNACKDELGALRVGAAVGTSADTDERVSRVGGGRRRRRHRRYRARPQPRRDRQDPRNQEEPSAAAADRGQHCDGAKRRARSLRRARTVSRSESVRARFARRASSRASVFRRSLRSPRSRARSPTRTCRSSRTVAFATRATSPRRSRPVRIRR